MSKYPKVSVIVPVYNNEDYLSECIDSLLTQTLEDIEILLIDDGSSDHSGIICDEYAQRDYRIKVIHKVNEGLGLTRNLGMQKAQGEYFTFLDSDDYVASDMYEKLWTQAKKQNAEACLCGITRVYEDKITPYELHLEKEFFYNEEIHNDLVYRMIGSAPDDKKESTIGYSMCTGIFKLDVVKKYNMKFFSEREYKVEDILFKIEYFSYITCITYIPDSCYMYRCNENSLTRKYRPDVLDATLKSYQKEFEILQEYGYEKGELYATRMLLADIRNSMRMIMLQEGFLKSISIYRQIARHPYLTRIMTRYPYNMNPINKKIFNYFLHHKLAVAMAVMIKINIFMRRGKD